MKKIYSVFATSGLVIFFALFLLSCVSVANTGIDASVEAGSFAQALQAMEKERATKGSAYADKNDILFYLDRGMVSHYAGRYEDSAADLEEAGRLIEEAFTKSLSQEVASYIANDNAKDYAGEDYEDLYVNVFNALNYYHLGDIDGALVEVRRVDEKLAVLSGKYEKAQEKVLTSAANLSGMDLGVEAVRFSNSALARYLGALFFRAKGDEDDARIDLDEVRRAYELAPGVYGNPLPSSLSEEGSVPQGMARLNVIGFTGLSPVKEEVRTNFVVATLALPKMVERPSGIVSAEVTLDTGQRFGLELLEDMGGVAQETFKAKYGLTVAKTAARTAIKAAATAVASDAASRTGGGAIAGFAVGLAGRAAADASEKADLRVSRFFPGRALVGGVNLEPGVYTVTVSYYGPGGALVGTDIQEGVSVEAGRLNLAEFVRLGTAQRPQPPANVASGRRTPAGNAGSSPPAATGGSSAAPPPPPVAAAAAVSGATTPPQLPDSTTSISTSASIQEKPRLGILPFTGGSASDGETIALLFSIQDDVRTRFNIVPRTSAVNAAVADRNFQASRSIDSDAIARIGRMLNVDYLISGYFRRLGDSNLVVATLINVETFELVVGDYRQYSSIEEIPAMLPSIAKNITANVGRDRSRLPALAIAPFRSAVTDDVEALAQVLPVAIANTGRYAVIPRATTVQTTLNAQRFQMPNSTDEDRANAIGLATNAGYVLFGDVQGSGTMSIFNVKILKAENGEEIASENFDYRLVGDGVNALPQLAVALSGGNAASVAVADAGDATTALTDSSTTGSDSTAEQPKKTISFNDDPDAPWKNKWMYLGGGLGLGSYSWSETYWNGYSAMWDKSKESTSLFAVGFLVDFAFLRFLSIETDLVFGFGGGSTIVAMPIMAKLGGRFAQVELSLDVGYTIGMGFSLGGTFGYHLGPGILFAKYINVPSTSLPGGIDVESAWMLFLGYKVGIIDKRRKTDEKN